MVIHWYAGVSTFNGKPFSPDAKTLCGKLRSEMNEEGDTVERIGASHPYQVTCKECEAELNIMATASECRRREETL